MITSLFKSIIVVGAIFLGLGGGLFQGGFENGLITYAQSPDGSDSQDQSAIEGTQDSSFLETADLLMRFLSWAWIVPASIAGELMTNEVIYGKSFYLSEVLFKFRQFMRTLSLYALGFLMLYKVGESFVKGGDVGSLGSTAVKAVVAGALIPMSWWLIAAVIDLSIIATAAISALPLNAMEQLRTELSLDGKISCSKVVYVKDFQVQPETDLPNNTQPLTFRDLVPAGDSVAGSMVFLGCGLLRLDQSLHLVNQEGEGINQTADQISSTFIRLIMVVMLVIPMFVLVVVNIIRIVFIWLRIITIPFIILAYTFDIGGLKDMEYFKIGNIIGLIFQPVVVVGTLSVGVLIIMGMYGALLGDEQTINQGMGEMINVYVDSDRTARIGTNGPAESIINGDIFGQTGDLLGGGIGRMVVTFFMVFLFWALIKIGFSTSALTKGVSDSMFDFATQIASTAPIVPVPGLGLQSVSSLSTAKQELSRNNPYQNKIAYESETISNALKEGLGIKDNTLKQEDRDNFRAISRSEGFGLRESIKKQQKDGKPIPIDSDIKTRISEWIHKNRSGDAKDIFTGITFPSSVGEIMKLRDSANDDKNPQAKTFRNIIDGILIKNPGSNNITKEWLKEAGSGGSKDGVFRGEYKY